eukprot:scaffold235906_cov18-Tisochrysis_lutea.AAC.1
MLDKASDKIPTNIDTCISAYSTMLDEASDKIPINIGTSISTCPIQQVESHYLLAVLAVPHDCKSSVQINKYSTMLDEASNNIPINNDTSISVCPIQQVFNLTIC